MKTKLKINTEPGHCANLVLCEGRAIHFTISETPSEFPSHAKHSPIWLSVNTINSYGKFYMFSNKFFVIVLNLLSKKHLTFRFFNNVITAVNT